MISRSRTLAMFAMLAAAAALPTAANAQMLSARVKQGKLSGVRERRVSAFLGVPFAAPPTGPNRWKAPQPAALWTGVRKAGKLPASCQQSVGASGFGPWTHEYVVGNKVSEDCLYLNVWTPARKAGAKLPVMVWIYGGGFSSGSNSVPLYDGSKLAAKGIVVIAVNYRVGLYGFLAHPALDAENSARASGNYGLMDQIAALKWVKVNVAAFSGGPDKVTIAGQSAGAMSVHHLIASPLAKDLFQQAIAQSGSGTGVEVPDHLAGEKAGEALMKTAGVSTIADLRKLTPDKLAAAQARMGRGGAGPGDGFSPIVDGLVLPDASYVGANTNDTPILTGMTAQEMTGLNPNFGKVTPEAVRQQIDRTYGSLAPKFAALYPASDDAQANETADTLARDRGLAAIALWARERQQTSGKSIYAYLWTHAEPGPNVARYGAFHSSEIPYVFDTLDASPERPFTDLDRRLAIEMGCYWVNFVKTGDTNGSQSSGKGLPAWPTYLPADKQILEIGTTTYSHPILPQAKLELFERHVAGGGKLGLF